MSFKLKYYILIFLGIYSSNLLFAGDKDKEFENFKEDGLEKLSFEEYDIALVDFLHADSISPGDPVVEYSIGVCYLNSPFPTNALPYIEKSEKHGSHDPYLEFNFGRADHINHLFDEAIVHYTKFLEIVDDTYDDQAVRERETKNFIEQCKSGKEIIKDTVNIEIRNLGSVLNTSYSEYVPVISADESSLFFTSRRPGSPDAPKDHFDHQYYEDIYYSSQKNGEWTTPVKLDDNINTDDHDACIGVSSDGQQLFIYKSRRSSNSVAGDIWVSNLDGDEWSTPEKLGSNINTKGWEPSAAISHDGKKLFFTSNREGGYGGTDIYESDMQENGEWGEAYNLGPTINTEFDEDAPFIHADNKTLFFSSNGPKSMGGFDIFLSTLDFNTKTWSEPQNIGYPINTASHDIYMVWNAARTRAYFATYREGSYGKQDLYVLERPFNDAHLVLLKGNVKDSLTGEVLSATIEVIDNETQEIVGEFTSNKLDGHYALTLPHGKNYSITAEKDGYMFYSKNINIPEQSAFEHMIENIGLQHLYRDDSTVTTEFALEEIALNRPTDEAENSIEVAEEEFENTTAETPDLVESNTEEVSSVHVQEVDTDVTITLNNVFFDRDKAELRATSYSELNKVHKLLTQHTDLCIELAGHTDSRNTEKYNQILSERRALAVVQYLVDKGIDAQRLVAVGYGELEPVASNDDDAGRQANRRTELKLIKKSDIANYDNRITGLNKLVVENGHNSVNEQSTSSYFYYSTKRKSKPQVGQILSLKIHFMFDNSDYISEFSSGQILKLISLLTDYPDLRLKLHAHADPFGDEIYNQELSEKRAETVYNYLVKLEIDPSRLEISTYGENVPLIESDDEAENIVNRRVEFEVIP